MAGGHQAAVPQFGQHEVDRQRQFRGGQQLVADLLQQVLQREILRQPLAQHLEEIGLFDVFFAFEHRASVAAAGAYVLGNRAAIAR